MILGQPISRRGEPEVDGRLPNYQRGRAAARYRYETACVRKAHPESNCAVSRVPEGGPAHRCGRSSTETLPFLPSFPSVLLSIQFPQEHFIMASLNFFLLFSTRSATRGIEAITGKGEKKLSRRGDALLSFSPSIFSIEFLSLFFDSIGDPRN